MSSAASGSSRQVSILDLGGCWIKLGRAGESVPKDVIPNCAVRRRRESRLVLPDEAREMHDHSAFVYRRPFEHGYMTDAALQAEILKRVFHKLARTPPTSPLFVIEPPFNFEFCRESMDKIVFDQLGFQHYSMGPGAALSALGCSESPRCFIPTGETVPRAKRMFAACCLVVDCGFSFTHCSPVINGHIADEAVRRVDLGGKHLSALLGEKLSFRTWNLADEPRLVNDVKEKLCFVSQDVGADLKTAGRGDGPENAIRKEFVMPNGSSVLDGYVKDAPSGDASGLTIIDPELQILPVNNERFQVPETLFHPNDAGVRQLGIHEAVVASARAAAEAVGEAKVLQFLLANVLLVGGTARMEGFAQRLVDEIRAEAPDECPVRVYVDHDPEFTTWRGASRMVASAREISTHFCSAAEYREGGHARCRKRFAGLT